MKSNYKRLGDYIREIKTRNSELKAEKLLGINIDKFFMPSVANIVGTDMSVYKIVKKNQFACNRMHVGRDYRLPISMSKTDEEFMVSPAYDVFEILDTDALYPEYLMMWFSRREFDRNAWFYTDADVRGGLHWKALCDMQLPIPSITKQKEIVKEYNVIQNRIALNQQLIQKLEETAQAIYKQWFVDFEFPDENGKPFKSSGGEMVFNQELEREIPKGWLVGIFKDLQLDVTDGNYSSKYPSYSEFKQTGVPFIRGTDFFGKCINPFNLLYISKEKHKELKKGHTKKGDILMGTRGEIGKYAFITNNFIDVNINAQLVRINGREKYPTSFLGNMLNSTSFKETLMSSTTGSALQQLPISNLMTMKLLIPPNNIILNSCEFLDPVHNHFMLLNEGVFKLMSAQNLLLSKLATIEN